MEGTYPPLVPADQRRSFYREIIEGYLKRSPESRLDNGTISVAFNAIRVAAKRK